MGIIFRTVFVLLFILAVRPQQALAQENPFRTKIQTPSDSDYLPDSELPAGLCRILFHHGNYNPASGQWEAVCSGVLVDKRRILTAAHCIKSLEGDKDMSAYVICAPGAFAWGQDAKGRLKHPDYAADPPSHDIAMLEVPDAFNVPSLPLAQSAAEIDELLKTPERCALFGAGLDNWNRTGVLHGARLRLINSRPLREKYGPYFIASNPNHAATGDSGGPVLCKDAAGGWRQIATHVLLIPEWKVSMHERIDHHLSWIDATRKLPGLPRD